MTYENLSYHLRNMVFDLQEEQIDHIYTKPLSYMAEYGRCRYLTSKILKSNVLYMYPEFYKIYEFNKYGVNLEQEPYKTIIKNCIDLILSKEFNNNDKIMLELQDNKETHMNISKRIEELSEQILNSEEYTNEINNTISLLEEKIGLEKTKQLMAQGFNVCSLTYIIPIIDELISNNLLEYIICLSTDEIKLCISTLKLIKIRNISLEEQENLFNMIIEKRFYDLYCTYKNILYETETISFIDDLIDNIGAKTELSHDEAQKIREYFIPYYKYISYDERELEMLPDGFKKYKNPEMVSRENLVLIKK